MMPSRSEPAVVSGASDVVDQGVDTATAPRKRSARRVPKQDPVLEAAIDRARAGVLEVTPEAQVGRHVSATVDGERLVTHRFEAFVPGYAGWQWYATVARISRSKEVTVCEVGLLPSDAALIAPAWLPWSERVRPEDSQPEDGGDAAGGPTERDQASGPTSDDDAGRPDAG